MQVIPGAIAPNDPERERGDGPNTPEVVAELLRRAILRGELVPGEHVRQPAWSEKLHVSRTVLREAFKILAGQRLLRHSPRAGYFVAKLDAGEMKELYRLRMLVEEEILRSIRWPHDDELAVLEDIFSRHMACLGDGSLTLSAEYWRDYTFKLFDLSPLRFTVEEGKRLWEMASPYRMVVLTTRLMLDPQLVELESSQREQFDALRAHDRDRLVKWMLQDRSVNSKYFAAQTHLLSLLSAS